MLKVTGLETGGLKPDPGWNSVVFPSHCIALSRAFKGIEGVSSRQRSRVVKWKAQ